MDVKFAYTMVSLNNTKIYLKIFNFSHKNVQNGKKL